LWVTKKESYKPRESDISPICPHGSIVMNFSVRGDITDVITHDKFYLNRFWCFGAVTLRNLGISIGMARGSYNGVSTAVLHCDIVVIKVTKISINLTVLSVGLF